MNKYAPLRCVGGQKAIDPKPAHFRPIIPGSQVGILFILLGQITLSLGKERKYQKSAQAQVDDFQARVLANNKMFFLGNPLFQIQKVIGTM